MLKQYKLPEVPGDGKEKNGRNNKGRGLNKNKKVKFMTVRKIILLSFLGLIFLFLLLAYLFLNFYRPSQGESPKVNFGDEFSFGTYSDDGSGETAPPEDLSGDRDRDCFTFLILGSDSGTNTDTIMAVMVNVKENSASVLNIPRDTYVSARNFSGKITNVYGRGRSLASQGGITGREEISKAGVEYVCAMIQYTFGIPIDKYVLINLEGFKVLVDEIKGVEVDVPMRMKYSDPEQNLYIDLYPGLQILDGNKAEQLVRFRQPDEGSGNPTYYSIGYAGEDLGRIKTQQTFLSAVMKKMINPIDLGNIRSLFEVGSKYMITNMTAADIGWFGVQMTNIKLENVRTHTLPGTWVSPHQVVYRQEAMEIINKYYNPFRKNIPESNFNIDDKGMVFDNKPQIDIDGVTMSELIR
ncbi:MAG: LCP family protein [Oscillospiraceae bacterium]|nr:LCP family protein [Oscillospiraceae bacterium]